MLSIFVRPERVGPKLSSIQGIRANLVYIVSLTVGYTMFVTYSFIFQNYSNFSERRIEVKYPAKCYQKSSSL